jgi:Tfp pilus assembly protein FimT
MRRIRRQGESGFTLVNLVMVSLVLGIIATAGLPSLNAALEDYRLGAAAEEIATALGYARYVAVNSGTQTKVTVDATADSILVEQYKATADILGTDTELPEADVETGAFANMERPMNRGADYSITLRDEERFNGVDITSSVFGAGNFVIFEPTGIPSEGGAVTLSIKSRQIVVSVDNVTGKVSVI